MQSRLDSKFHFEATLKMCVILIILCCIKLPSLFAQLQNPEKFLGHKIGDAFSYHHELMGYAKHVAENSPRAVFKNYGASYEGREMGILIFASEKNQKRLEEVRLNNLKITGLADGNAQLTDAPAIVWLSYNVHGNEASCSEAAMLAMQALADSNNPETTKWLENTVVIIDPALNPDGRERYVFNYNQLLGRFPNADPSSREHRSNWPSGRTNHYYFDLNRDWAWQTQVESQQRAVIYQEWMPHVHADYHEMGYNSPYYFAPAAEPFHVAITEWQKEFQTTIGKNHARHFDKEGWLYYTGQVFDLFYPSYGDTWPTFNGAIGMTYEQGGIGAGLKVVTMIGDTLTLNARTAHHLTTSLSTIEATSDNAAKVVNEFVSYFDKSQAAEGFAYKAYGIKAANNPDNTKRLLSYLDKQKIRYSSPKTARKLDGYNFKSGRSEKVEVENSDIIIPVNQPKGILVSVLFEPDAVLTDSLTYDITAWQSHYMYGLDGYALKNAVDLVEEAAFEQQLKKLHKEPIKTQQQVYAYVSNWASLEDAKFLSELLQHDIKVKYADMPFTLKGQKFKEGAIIVTKADNEKMPNFWKVYERLAQKYERFYLASETGLTEEGADLGSNNVHYMSKKKVLLLADNDISQYNLGEIWHFFDQEIGYPATIAEASRLGRLNLANYDVLILAEGYYRDLLDGKLDRIKTWVKDGGTLIALGSANNFLAGKEGFDLMRKMEADDVDKEKAENMDYDTFAERERQAISNVINGAIYPVTLDNTHPLGYGLDKQYFTLKLENDHYAASDNLWNVGVIHEQEQRSGFSGAKGKKGIDQSLSFAVQDMGSGKVVYLIDNVLYRAFWINGKLLVANAVFFD